MEQRGGLRLLAALRAPCGAHALPRTMVVAAHPDDETVGAGSRLPWLAQARFAYLTDGAPRSGDDARRHGLSVAGYAQARRRELQEALALCGIGPGQVLHLGYPDQRGARHAAEAARRLAQLFAQHGVESVLTHPYEGGHPDHDAAALAVHAAAALMRRAGQRSPDIVEMACYHRGADGLRSGAFLPDAAADARAVVVELDAREQQRKRALVHCFRTQRETLRVFPLAVERFRPAPCYDFLRPPHPGRLHYEDHPWGMTGERFRGLVAEAFAQLRLEGSS